MPSVAEGLLDLIVEQFVFTIVGVVVVLVAKLHSLSFNTLEFLNIAHASIWAHELGSATSSGSNTI
jgi:hypothetical protein